MCPKTDPLESTKKIWNDKWHEFVQALRTSKKSQRQLDEIVVLLNTALNHMGGQDGLSIPCFWHPHMTWVISWHMQDIIFESVWNLFFDLMIEMAATYKVNVSLDLRKKKAWLRRFNVCGAMVPLCPLPSPWPVASFVWGSDGSSVDQLHSTLGKSADSRDPVGDATKPGSLVVEMYRMYAMTSWHSMYFCFKLCFNHAKHDRHFFPVSNPSTFFQNFMESLRAISKHGVSTGHFLHTSSSNVRWSSYQSYDVCFNPPRSPWIGWVFAVPWSVMWVNGERILIVFFKNMFLIFRYLHEQKVICIIYITINHIFEYIHICTAIYHKHLNPTYYTQTPKTCCFQQGVVTSAATTSEAMLWGKMVRRFWPRHCPAARWQIYNCKVTWMKRRRHGCFRKWWYPQIIHLNRVFSITNHPFWGTTIYGNTHMELFSGGWVSDIFLYVLKSLKM